LVKPLDGDLTEWFFAVDNLTFGDASDAAQPATPISTLSHWMKLVMVLLLAGVGMVFTSRLD
jgi:hypothetical protein